MIEFTLFEQNVEVLSFAARLVVRSRVKPLVRTPF